MYEGVVTIGFWGAAIIGGITTVGDFSDTYPVLDYAVTIIVHGAFPIPVIVFVVIMYKKNPFKFTKNQLIWAGVYPLLYMFWYLLISLVWYDPYSMTDIHDHFFGVRNRMPTEIRLHHNLRYDRDLSINSGVNVTWTEGEGAKAIWTHGWMIIMGIVVIYPISFLTAWLIFNKLLNLKGK